MSAMAVGGSLQLSYELGVVNNHAWSKPWKGIKMKGWQHFSCISLSSFSLRQDAWSLHVFGGIYWGTNHSTYSHNCFICRSFPIPNVAQDIPILKTTSLVLTRSFNALLGSPLPLRLAPAVGIIVFSVWGLGQIMRYGRDIFHNDSNWKKTGTHFFFDSYLQPLLFWTGAILACRTMNCIVLPSEASEAVKQRLLTFVRSSSTVLAFACCFSSLIQQTQKFFMKKNSSDEARKMGFQFAGRAVYTAVWIAAFSLFMELLGFSTQKWLTAGGLGTVLLTLAGREHVGWWSPTIIRGDDREAVHIPNHKFTVTVVRNLSQKTHWRIKTHLAISHLDANKISNLVADMRKILAKNPQIEQQRLHRRVFLDNINPGNQALLILISCFVKSSRFEEYLCVKEAVLQDLLRVISHYRARLATPVRTVQNIYGDACVDNIPYAETVFTRAGAPDRRFLLVEPSSRISTDDKTKTHLTVQPFDDQMTKTSTKSKASANRPNEDQIASSSHSVTKSDGHNSVDGSESVNEHTAPARPSFEDNIVLGVALEGSRRTLPIEEVREQSPAATIEVQKVVGAASNSNRPPSSSSSSSSTVKDKNSEVPNKDSL